MKARNLTVAQIEKRRAVEFIRETHSVLPKTQLAPWSYAFGLFNGDTLLGAALWLNPSARTLPGHWLELRRLALSDEAPYNSASRFISEMTKYFRCMAPEREQLISYQDVSVHCGTIYKASNWKPLYISRPRQRDRSKKRCGTNRKYRSDANGIVPASSAKIRWHQWLNGAGKKFVMDADIVDIEKARSMVATK